MKKSFIFINSIMVCGMLYVTEQVVGTNYLIKTIAKIMLFTLIPLIYIARAKLEPVKDSLNFRGTQKGHFWLGALFGILSFLIILAAYFTLKDFIDLGAISSELQNKLKITPNNFILVGLYIIFVNSFLEEFFFRGFIFLGLYEMGHSKLAYIFSSVLFAIYHIAIFKTWFSPGIMLLALVGLIAVGFIFDWLDTKSNNFINSWVVHALADCAVILIGLRMFNIV